MSYGLKVETITWEGVSSWRVSSTTLDASHSNSKSCTSKLTLELNIRLYLIFAQTANTNFWLEQTAKPVQVSNIWNRSAQIFTSLAILISTKDKFVENKLGRSYCGHFDTKSESSGFFQRKFTRKVWMGYEKTGPKGEKCVQKHSVTIHTHTHRELANAW